MNNWKPWLKALLSAFIVAACTAAGAAMVGVHTLQELKIAAIAGLIAGLGGAINHLRQSPLPLVLIALLLCGAAQAQVSAQFSPEPMAVMSSLNIRSMGLWSVRMCNDGAAPVLLPEERIYMAAPGLSLIMPVRARAILLTRQASTQKATVVRYIKYGLIGAAGLTGFGAVAASTTVIASLASGAALAGEVQRTLELEIPSIAPFADSLLEGPITLPPGGCATRTAFAAKVKNPKAITAQIQIR